MKCIELLPHCATCFLCVHLTQEWNPSHHLLWERERQSRKDVTEYEMCLECVKTNEQNLLVPFVVVVFCVIDGFSKKRLRDRAVSSLGWEFCEANCLFWGHRNATVSLRLPHILFVLTVPRLRWVTLSPDGASYHLEPRRAELTVS